MSSRSLWITFMLAAALLAGCATQQSKPAPDASERLKPGDNVAYLRVNGMSCPLCANNVTQQLKLVRGVEQVDIDLGKGVVLVLVSPERRPTSAQFKAAIAASGFTLVDMNIPWPDRQPATQPAETQPAESQ